MRRCFTPQPDGFRQRQDHIGGHTKIAQRYSAWLRTSTHPDLAIQFSHAYSDSDHGRPAAEDYLSLSIPASGLNCQRHEADANSFILLKIKRRVA
jgi:hypothetical protein